MKVKAEGGVAGRLGALVEVASTNGVLTFTIKNNASSKRQLKYLTKRMIKANQLTDYLRVTADKKDSYVVKYRKVAAEGGAEEEEAEVDETPPQLE